MSDILTDYDNQAKSYAAYSKSLESLLSNLLSHNEIRVHSITSRVKEKQSLEVKIESKGPYSCIGDITDIVGIRIIAHYADEVDAIAQVIENEFNIDRSNSIDKRATLEPDRFGYLSLHYIISLKNERTSLPEYEKFKNIKAELQIRSILQHTWAEIEHDIGYKSGVGVPREVKRQFSRLAGLLEIGDAEFINIRNTLQEYAKKVKNGINDNSITVPLDRVSLKEYVNSSSIFNEIIKQANKKYSLRTLPGSEPYFNFALRNLLFVGVDTTAKLDELLNKHRDSILKKYGVVVKRRRGKEFELELPFAHEVFFVYLTQYLIVNSSDPHSIDNYINEFRKYSKDNDTFTKELIEVFKE